MRNLICKTASVLFFLGSLCSNPSNGQGTLAGRIIDKSTKYAIPFASVQIQGFKGVIADSTGSFSLDISEGTYIIVISSVGHQEKIIYDVQVIYKKVKYLEIEQEPSAYILEGVEVKAHVFRYENNPLTPISTFGFSRDEIARNPGAQGDIFRAIGMLPGVSSSGGAFSAIAVRGQGTRDNLYTVDDVPMRELGHLDGSPNGFSDPNGARFSIFAPRVIDNAEFQGGGFSAQYGRKSASFLGLAIKEGNKKNPILDGQADLLGLTLNYDGPSYLHKNTSLFISIRYQNFVQALKLVKLTNLGIPEYADFIVKSTTDLNVNNKLSVTIMYNPEKFVRTMQHIKEDIDLNNLALIDYANAKSVVALNLRTLISQKSYWKNIVYHTLMKYDAAYGLVHPQLTKPMAFGEDKAIKNLSYRENEIGYRSIFTNNLNLKTSFVIGFDINRINLRNQRSLAKNDTLYLYAPNDYIPDNHHYAVITPRYFYADYRGASYNASLYATFSHLLFNNFMVNAGLRYDYTGFSKEGNIAPRLSLNYQMNEKSSLSFATGIFYQNPLYNDIADQPAGKLLKNERVAQYIFGYKTYFAPDLKLTVEAWYKSFDRLVIRPVSGTVEQINTGTGWAKGIDISLVKRLTTNFHGQLSYSYMESMRNDHDGLGNYPFTFSQPNQLNLMLVYKKTHWNFSAKYRYATGKPTHTFLIHQNIFNNEKKPYYAAEIIRKNDRRLPDFMSLDVRLDYFLRLKKHNLSLFIDVVNVFNRKNQNQELFNYILGQSYYDGVAIFPTGGLKFEL